MDGRPQLHIIKIDDAVGTYAKLDIDFMPHIREFARFQAEMILNQIL